MAVIRQLSKNKVDMLNEDTDHDSERVKPKMNSPLGPRKEGRKLEQQENMTKIEYFKKLIESGRFSQELHKINILGWFQIGIGLGVLLLNIAYTIIDSNNFECEELGECLKMVIPYPFVLPTTYLASVMIIATGGLTVKSSKDRLPNTIKTALHLSIATLYFSIPAAILIGVIPIVIFSDQCETHPELCTVRNALCMIIVVLYTADVAIASCSIHFMRSMRRNADKLYEITPCTDNEIPSRY